MENENELAEAVKAWVRAEWHYRCGPEAYTTKTQDWYLNAERELRRAGAGKADLEKAYARLTNTSAP